jgi:predicted nucleic acid-binding Zn finger protein
MKMRWTQRIWVMPSTSQLNTQYEVRICTDGAFVCTCPDFLYRGNECKHIKKVKMQLAGEKQKNKLPGAKE